MITRRVICVFAILFLSTSLTLAGIRSAGKYSGVVVFDRWGGCTLYSGVYVMYISESVKEQLREHAGKCVLIDATTVEQPENPGDGLIKKFTYLGGAPEGRAWESPKGLEISIASTFKNGESPAFDIAVKNTSDQPKTIRMENLAPTLLAKKGPSYWGPSDGPSEAVITRSNFWIGGNDGPRMVGGNDTWGWKVTKPEKIEKEYVLKPDEKFEISLTFSLPKGEYEFLAGYGGGVQEGQTAASKLIAFDVDDKSHATAVEPPKESRTK